MNHSSYSMIEGIPVALIGVLGYPRAGVARACAPAGSCSLRQPVGLAFSLYLAHIEREITGRVVPVLRDCAGDIALIMVLGLVWLALDAASEAQTLVNLN